MFCRKCGTENDDNVKFCKNCGEPVSSTYLSSMGNGEVTGAKKKKSKLPLLVIGIILIILACFCAVFVMLNNKKAVREYENCLLEGERYFEEMDYEKAEDSYLMAIEIDAKQKEPYLRLADIYVAQNEMKKAVEILEQALDEGVEDTSDDGEEGEIHRKIKEIQDLSEINWIVEPTIEADNIFYLQIDKPYGTSVNEIQMQDTKSYAFIEKDGLFGLIDMEGKMLSDFEFYNAINYYDVCLLYSVNTIYVEEYQANADFYIFDGEEFIPYFGFGGDGRGMFYYLDGLRSMYNHYNEVPVYKTEDPFPIREAAELYVNERTDYTSWEESLSDKYAVFYENKLITDFIYDECGSYADGLMAVCQDGKWGYIDADGNLVIPIEYDASWSKYRRDMHLEFEDYCYSASDGYVNLCKDGKWELRDIEGNLVIKEGIFEKILPVYDGKCWVMQDGKWGVIQVAGEAKDDNSLGITAKDNKVIKDYLVTNVWTQWGYRFSDSLIFEFKNDGSVLVKDYVEEDVIWECTYELDSKQLIIYESDGVVFAKYEYDDLKKIFNSTTYQHMVEQDYVDENGKYHAPVYEYSKLEIVDE